jgi:hypothetical protein
MKLKRLFAVLALLTCGVSNAAYWGEEDSVNVTFTGCNAVSNFQIPGQLNLFIGRAYFDPTGHPIASNCSTTASQEAGTASRVGLVLNQLNWATNTFSIIKPLLATQQGALTGGPLKGYTLRSAYDPSIALFNGKYWVSFECIVLNSSFGTSSCLASFNNTTQTIDPNSIHVVVRSTTTSTTTHTGAAVPALLVFNGNLYMYWSATTRVNGIFTRIAVRGAQLAADSAGYFWVKGAAGKITKSLDATSIEVWGLTASDPLSNSAVDIKSIWATSTGIVAAVSIGGSGCFQPGPQAGCWRLAMAEVKTPLGFDIFNKVPLLDAPSLPTNGQGYTRAVKTPTGNYALMGNWEFPTVNGFSELRPAPESWTGLGSHDLIVFGFSDAILWPIH